MWKPIFLLLVFFFEIILICGFNSRKRIADRVPFNTNVFSITGHRGAGGLAQENTLSAIRKGMELKCARIEIDIHQTSDNVIVVMHDDTIDRMTNGKGKIKEMTYARLQEYKIKPFLKGDTAMEKIPTLEQAFETVNGKAILLIELKEGDNVYPQIEEQVIAMIRKYKAEHWCMIHSFKDDILDRVHSMAPDIPLHRLLLTGMFSGSLVDDYVTEISVFNRLLTKSFIDKVHKAGKKINVWTVNNRDDMEYFIHMGVDGIITDFPDLANQVWLESTLKKE